MKLSRWVPMCVGFSFAVGCYDTGGRGDPDAGTVLEDARRSDARTGGILPERCELSWLRTIPVNPVGLGLVISIATDRDENVLISFYNANTFILDGVSYPGGGYLMGLDRENRLHVRPSERQVVLTSTEGRIISAATDSSGMTSLVELDGRTGEALRDFGAFRAAEFWEPEAAFVGETLVWSMSVAGEFAFPGEAMRVLPRGTGIVLAIRPDGWRGIGEFEGRIPMTSSPDGALLMGATGPLCFDGVCQDVRSMRRLIREDGSVRGVPEARVDFEASPSEIRSLADESLVTFGVVLSVWRPDGSPSWTQTPPFLFNLESVALAERESRVVTMTSIEEMPMAMLGSLQLDVGANKQELFIDFSLTDGTPLRWWHIENPDGAGRSGATRLVMGASGRSYAAGIADPIVDVCGTRVMDGLFVAAFD